MVRLTADLPGCGGTFRPGSDDFEVEEIPLYEASGEGEHLYLTIEKVGLGTRDVVRRAVRVFGVDEAEVGYAGLKDKHARTVQTISVRGVSERDARRLEGDGVVVRAVRRHRNKLRVGHLRGNRFRVRIRGVEPGGGERARAVLEALARAGLPNFFGEQRFGRGQSNAEAGREVLRRGPRAAGSKWKAKLFVSALQAELFNAYLEGRMARGAFGEVRAGDLLVKVASGGLFECQEPRVDQARHDRFEVSITGPMFGHSMRTPGGEPGAWEAEVLARAGLAPADFERAGRIAEGTRRPLRASVAGTGVERVGDDVWLSFELPPGAYATVLVAEVLGAG